MTAKHTIGIVIFDGVLTSEVIAPAEVFGIAVEQAWFNEWRVVMIGVEQKPMIISQEGIKIGVDCTIHDEPTLDVLIVPGGYDMESLFNNTTLDAFIKKHEEIAQWVSSNCSGAFLLAHAGVLDGKQATTWFGGEVKLQEQYPLVNVVMDNPVVIDNRRLTSNGGIVSYQAALVLLGKLASAEHAHEVYETLTMGRVGTWSDMEQAILNA